jgi:glycolate oxidase iron-sulfur subunit
MEREPALARAVRAEKLAAIADSGAEIVATPNPGCMLWLWRGLQGRRVRVRHPVSLLADASVYSRAHV